MRSLSIIFLLLVGWSGQTTSQVTTTQWYFIGLPTDNIVSIALRANGDVFAGTYSNGLFRLVNGTNVWAPVLSPSTCYEAYCTAFDRSGGVLTGTYAGGLYRSPDDGHAYNWSRLSSDTPPDNLPIESVLAVAVAPNGHIFVSNEQSLSTHNGEIYRSTDLGQTWARVRPSSSGLSSVVVNDAGVVYAGGNDWFYYSLNDGTNWTWVGSGSGLAKPPLYLAVIRDYVFAGTSGGGVYVSHDNGAHWTNPNFGLTNLFITSIASHGDRLFVGTNGGGIFYSDDYGQVWYSFNAGLTNLNVRSISFDASSIYVGTNAGVWKYGDALLPVELVSVKAMRCAGTVSLQWSTATEVNNYGFDIERAWIAEHSPAAREWRSIGFVAGSGTCNTRRSYEFTDTQAGNGAAYRLKQMDRDGKFSYSAEVVAAGVVPAVFNLSQNYPNPFNPTTAISFTVPATGRATLKIFTSIGQEVATLFDGEAKDGVVHNVTFDASGVASGVYYSRLGFQGSVRMMKMVVVK